MWFSRISFSILLWIADRNQCIRRSIVNKNSLCVSMFLFYDFFSLLALFAFFVYLVPFLPQNIRIEQIMRWVNKKRNVWIAALYWNHKIFHSCFISFLRLFSSLLACHQVWEGVREIRKISNWFVYWMTCLAINLLFLFSSFIFFFLFFLPHTNIV